MAAALLRRQGRRVIVLEREQFPRFSIGESLLPQSMQYLEEAGMLRAVQEGGFQLKDGAVFVGGPQRSQFDFQDKFSTRMEHDLPGPTRSIRSFASRASPS